MATMAVSSTARATFRSPERSRTSNSATFPSRETPARCRRIPHHELHAPAHHHDAAPSAETERLRRSRATARYPRRRTNRERELRADAQIQLLEHLHRPAIRPLQRKPHPLRRLRKQPPILPDAPKRSRRSRRHGRDIGLTELTKHAILSYPLPDQQSGEKFAAFTYLHNDAQNPICGTAHNVASPEMLYISGSSGAQFDERAEHFAERMT